MPKKDNSHTGIHLSNEATTQQLRALRKLLSVTTDPRGRAQIQAEREKLIRTQSQPKAINVAALPEHIQHLVATIPENRRPSLVNVPDHLRYLIETPSYKQVVQEKTQNPSTVRNK